MPLAKTIMIQGTGSGVGKSILAAALCRIFKQKGLRVAPFKAQNMSNNSFVAEEGGEIGRAQAMQAECAGIKPSIHMNPILIKPHSNSEAQIIVQGRPVSHMNVHEYHRFHSELFAKVKASLFKLLNSFDVVVIEGAGSPAEINLTDFDIVNMRVARLVNAPVILVGDIDRGGVFASLYGTYVLLSPSDRKRVKGLIINKFRGDQSLLGSGIRFLEQKMRVPVLGVVPYMEDIILDEEDSLDLPRNSGNGKLDVAVLRFPRISNFTDFKALALEPFVSVRYIGRKEEFGDPDLLILPGTKSTVDDLKFLKNRGILPLIKRYAKGGGAILGICGGFQMLGQTIEDRENVESRQRKVAGMGLLPVKTFFAMEKITRKVKMAVEWRVNGHVLRETVKGYEIHMGRTVGLNRVSGNSALFSKGSIFGTYLHGLFDNDSFRTNFLESIFRRKKPAFSPSGKKYSTTKEKNYRFLARTVENSIDLKRILSLLTC